MFGVFTIGTPGGSAPWLATRALKALHAIAAVAVPVEIDHHELVGATWNCRQRVGRAVPPVGDDVALGGGALLPPCEQRALVGTGGKYLHPGIGERERSGKVGAGVGHEAPEKKTAALARP